MSGPHLSELVARRLSRRQVLVGLGAVAAGCARGAEVAEPGVTALGDGVSSLGGLAAGDLPAVRPGRDDRLHIAAAYRAQVLLRWGDPITAAAAGPFDIHALDAEAQGQRFGSCNDFLAFLPLTDGEAETGLLVVNHEFIGPRSLPPELAGPERSALEQACHGMSVVALRLAPDGWRVDLQSAFNRRLTANSPIRLTGPAAGSPRLKTAADPTGRAVLGTLHNCSGGLTPWGTVLSGEENILHYFRQVADPGPIEGPGSSELGLKTAPAFSWHQHEARFDLAREPHEANRFGWMLELDPRDPSATPAKRTALGRFFHEGAAITAAADGRAVVFMGDDSRDRCLYRFVSAGPAGVGCLDEGELWVARFDEHGGRWLPLRHGEGPLVAANGFRDAADVLIDARRAARRVGGTPMDRPERVELGPDGSLWVVLTGNSLRAEPSPANPRAPNPDGHILKLSFDAPTADRFTWQVVLQAGHDTDDGARYGAGATEQDRFSGPDNLAFGPSGSIWIGTDSSYRVDDADGLYLCLPDEAGWLRPRRILRAPTGAEVTGPCFTPDGRTLFVSIQHPGDEHGSTHERPSTRWPDFDDALPPRSAVLALTREDGLPVG